MARLVIHSGTPQAREYELKAGANSLGRNADNDFTIDEPSISSFHAQIFVDDGSISIKDLGSTNGTFINHTQVNEGVIQPGQFIRLGGVFLIFEGISPASPAAPGGAPVVIPTVAAPRAAPGSIGGAASTPAGGGLKITGLNRAAAAVPPPIPAPPPPPRVPLAMTPTQAMTTIQGLVEPPEGKTACKFHPKSAGEWLCRECNELFCSVCVSPKRMGEATGFFCRKCGSACVPVKAKVIAPREKPRKKYSDGVILFRSVAFGFLGALLSALIWTGLSWLFGVDIPFIFSVMSAAICGYAVKFGSLDTPGALFSAIAVVCCVIGSVLGKVGMLVVTHLMMTSGTSLITTGLGVVLSIYVAWKIGGGDS